MLLSPPRTSVSLVAVAITALSLASGCKPNAGSKASAGPPPTATAALAAVPSRRCGIAEARCASDGEVEACSEDGQRIVRSTCDEASVCLAGRCASLRAALPKREVVLRRADLQRISGEGWLNGWSITGPLRGSESKALLDDPSAVFPPDAPGSQAPPREPALRAACGPTGNVPIHERAKQKIEAPESMFLAGYVVSPAARKIQIRAGFTGGLRVFVNGSSALDAIRPASPRPFKDELIADAELRAGVNSIVIASERSFESASGLWIRLRDSEGLPIPELRFAPASPQAACAIGDLARVDLTPAPVQGGFSIDVGINLVGLSPMELPEAPFRAEIRQEGKPAEEIGKGTIALSEAPQGKAKVSLSMRPPARGPYELTFTIGEKGEVTARSKIVYRGALHEKIVDLARRMEALPKEGGAPEASRSSITYHVRSVVQSLAESHPDEPWIAKRAADADAIVKAMAAGEDPYREKKGVVRRAYVSELDGELQPYVVVVPPSYKPDKAMPLIVTFHGLDSQPEHALRAVIGRAPKKDEDTRYAGRHLPAFPDYGVLLAAPWGYGKAGPRQLGEHDVLRVVSEMRAHYKVDDRRISITGASLGGTVAFVVPLHYPDVFSASAPLCGYPNLLTYQSVRSVPHTPWEETLLTKRYIGNYAENGLHLPLHIVHGGLDAPERSRVIADRYRALGYSYTFDVQDELDHNVWEYAYEDGQMIAWLRARRRPEAPSRARLVTGEYRYSKAYWVRLIGMQDDAKLAEIDARWSASASASAKEKESSARVTTRNVESFALDLHSFKVPANSTVVVDGRSIDVPEGAGTVFFTLSEGGFKRVEAEPSREGKKRPGVSGPLDDVLRHPVIVVYGTQDPAQTEANRMVAEHASSYDTWAYARFPIKADSDVTPGDLAGKSVVLVGGPTSNKLTAEMINGLPVRFEPNAVILRGKRYEGSDVGVSLIYPRPDLASEYVVLHAGVTAKGTLASRHLPQLAPDYLVYDGRITAQRAELLLEKRAVLDGGFFTQDWK